MKRSLIRFVLGQRKKVAVTLLTIMATELLLPLRALALTSGPSQPEFQGFSPLATTTLVDPFTGDFSYSIPLLDIEGYPLSLVYRATSNVEEESSWVGYGWNLNIGTLNRLVRGLPDDMRGAEIKTYQNIRERRDTSTGVSVGADFGVSARVSEGVGVSAGVQGQMGLTKDKDNYTGHAVGVSVGGGVYAGVNAGPFSVSASAGVTLAANSGSGGTISTYAGFNAGLAANEYFSVGMGRSVNRTFNTISGWENPTTSGTLNISHVTRVIQKRFINSVSNQIPQVTSPYLYSSNGKSYKLELGLQVGVLEQLGLDLGVNVTMSKNFSTTRYDTSSTRRGYGYMYYEDARDADLVDFTRDNDEGINKDLPFMPPAMKTFDVFSSTAYGATPSFRADRNDFGLVRDPRIEFTNTKGDNTAHEVNIRAHISLDCWIGVSLKYDNIKTNTEGFVATGGCAEDMIAYRKSSGPDRNLYFKACGNASMADDDYLNQVNGTGFYGFDPSDQVRGFTPVKRMASAEPIVVYTNDDIAAFPQTVIMKKLANYKRNSFPANEDTSLAGLIARPVSGTDGARIGAIINTTSSGRRYVYGIPIDNHLKNEVAFRVSGFDEDKFRERDGIMKFTGEDAPAFNGQLRDELYKSTVSPSYSSALLLCAVLSPDYVDVTNDGISDDDLGGFVKFNYTKMAEDYRWRIPYGDKDSNLALLNQGVKVAKFDNTASYVSGSKDLWYAHSIESKNEVAEFYLADRKDGKDTRAAVMTANHPYGMTPYYSPKEDHAYMQRLDSIKYYNKHDRYINGPLATPLKTIYFDYDYGISSRVPNGDTAVDSTGKLRLLQVRVRHGDEPMIFCETYDFDYVDFNPAYRLGDKDGWGNYYPNNRPLPLCEFPYIDQGNREDKDMIASAFHLNGIGLPSGGAIQVTYEADDYSYVQNKRAMSLVDVVGVGPTPNVVHSDVYGLYDGGLNPYLYIYAKKPKGVSPTKGALLGGSNLLYFSFHINIAGNAFSTYDQVKGYAEVDDAGLCPNDGDYIWVRVKPIDLTGTSVKPSAMTNTAINMARAYASDQLYFQQQERPDGKYYDHFSRLKKAMLQVGDAVLGRNSIKELMKDYKAGHQFIRQKSYIRLVMGEPKIGGGSRVSELTFGDEWNQLSGAESSSLVGYRYRYTDETGSLSSGVASWEPTLGGEENPFRSATSYRLSTNSSKYPPYDPIEMVKEDPIGESFLPSGSVGYSRVVVESIHKDYARSARSIEVKDFYTSRDFPYLMAYSPRHIMEVKDEQYPNPGIRDILLSFLGVSNTISSSKNVWEVSQQFVVETNDMHGKEKAQYRYRLLPKGGKKELVSSTQYFYHSQGSRLMNKVSVLQHRSDPYPDALDCLGEIQYLESEGEMVFPKGNLEVRQKTLGVDVDICTDSREVVTTENRNLAQRGGGVKVCLPPFVRPKFSWVNSTHHHLDYFKSTTTTKIVNRYGILSAVRNVEEGLETIVENKYYDAITGSPVVRVVKDKYGDNIFTTEIPAYWTKTDLEPSYLDYPFRGIDIFAQELEFKTSGIPEGIFGGTSLLQAYFTTGSDAFHPGDELFVQAGINGGSSQWHRLYVIDVTTRKLSSAASPDPLSRRFGSGHSSGSEFRVYVSPYKVSNPVGSELKANDKLTSIGEVIKFNAGRRNMLDLKAGSYQTYEDPFVITDSVSIYSWDSTCRTPNYMKPSIEASAVRYASLRSIPDSTMGNLIYNPVSMGLIGLPYLSHSYILYGNREDPSGSGHQRHHGILRNWYYWLPNRSDSTEGFIPLKALMSAYGNFFYDLVAYGGGKARWYPGQEVTQALPSVGAVEERDPQGVYQSIDVSASTKRIRSVTSNGKYGQTWTESFDDMQELLKYNQVTDFLYSPFRQAMSRTPSAGGV